MQGSLGGSLALGSQWSVAAQSLRPEAGELPTKVHGSRVVMSLSTGRRPLGKRGIAAPEDVIPTEKFYWRNLEERQEDSTPALTADAGFLQRLSVAWSMLFPKPVTRNVAQVAKSRLKLVLNSDRMQVSPHLKHSLCNNIVDTMSDFVIVNKDADVQFAVHRAPETGSVYLIKVPVARVKPNHQLEMQPIVEAIEHRQQ